MTACALAPVYAVALVAVASLGLGNGIALVSENVLLQQLIPNEFRGRVFGIKSSLISWAFAIAFFSAGALGSVLGARAMYGVAAGGCLLAYLNARTRLAGDEHRVPAAAPATT